MHVEETVRDPLTVTGDRAVFVPGWSVMPAHDLMRRSLPVLPKDASTLFDESCEVSHVPVASILVVPLMVALPHDMGPPLYAKALDM